MTEMLPVLSLAALLSLAVVGVLARAPLKAGGKKERPFIVALALGTILLSFGIYLGVGRPGLPGRARTAEERNAARVFNNAMLAKRPAEILTTVDPGDASAMMVLGEISKRFGHKGDAVRFYSRAFEIAVERRDPHAIRFGEVLGLTQVEYNGGAMGDNARKTFMTLLTIDPRNPVARGYLNGYSVPYVAPQHKSNRAPGR
jgi:cytochrome c-type biogenesis protein CcmH/NrfG